jgi:hypothetical protein
MTYEFKIEQNVIFELGLFETHEEAFESALNCAASAVESILTDYELSITCKPPFITISSENEMPFTLDECAQKIKVSFHSDNTHLYPEFAQVTCKSI